MIWGNLCASMLFTTFSKYCLFCKVWSPVGSLLAPFCITLAPFWLPFGSLLAVENTLWAPFQIPIGPFGHLMLYPISTSHSFFTPDSANHPRSNIENFHPKGAPSIFSTYLNKTEYTRSDPCAPNAVYTALCAEVIRVHFWFELGPRFDPPLTMLAKGQL